MAYQVGASCYGDAAAALSATASAQAGAVVVHGGAAYVVDVAGVTSSSITYRLNPVAGGQAIQSTVQMVPEPCGLLDWADGLSLGWGIAVAWIATAAVMHLRVASRTII
ncbi:hypothetical protein [Xylophilus sp.]|uniref:hypothetical protein n=1 Tax=Xylophilus sp. TaxID=2653893 RepID=UPI0013B78BCB|nr:hypothetical protein [Xylophilus sp.]KAF1043558.1 MAG: hypothetical protein GAK38_03894 [Xylophilus sp.]